MFRKKDNSSQDNAGNVKAQAVAQAKPHNVETAVSPQYPKLKVLLLDLKDDSEAILRATGYNIHVGTLGTPYLVSKSNSYEIVATDFKVPNYAEQGNSDCRSRSK